MVMRFINSATAALASKHSYCRYSRCIQWQPHGCIIVLGSGIVQVLHGVEHVGLHGNTALMPNTTKIALTLITSPTRAPVNGQK